MQIEEKTVTTTTYKFNGRDYTTKELAQQAKDYYESFSNVRDHAKEVRSKIQGLIISLIEEGFCDDQHHCIKSLNDAHRSLRNIIGD